MPDIVSCAAGSLANSSGREYGVLLSLVL
jgi:site-specific DNA recombinase